jgi:hypothetical protein
MLNFPLQWHHLDFLPKSVPPDESMFPVGDVVWRCKGDFCVFRGDIAALYRSLLAGERNCAASTFEVASRSKVSMLSRAITVIGPASVLERDVILPVCTLPELLESAIAPPLIAEDESRDPVLIDPLSLLKVISPPFEVTLLVRTWVSPFKLTLPPLVLILPTWILLARIFTLAGAVVAMSPAKLVVPLPLNCAKLAAAIVE